VLLAQANEVVEASVEFEAVLALVPDHPDAHFDLAQILVALGQWEEARPHLEAVVRARPELRVAREKLADVYEQLGLAEEARRMRSGSPP